MPSIDQIVADPAWLPHRYDAGRGVLTFVLLSKEDHRGVTFLSDEYLGQRQAVTAPVTEVRAALSGRAKPPAAHFIFHTAFCCSTLLTRAMDRPGRSFGLKEPYLLVELAALGRRGGLDPALLAVALDLFSRSFEAGERIVIKPGNDANLLIAPLLGASPDSRALLLSSALDDFLLSVAKKGMWGRLWARRLYRRVREEGGPDAGFSEAELFQQTDLQIAAMGWILQRARFVEMTARFPGRLVSLDSAALLADRPGTIARLDVHYGFPAQAREEAGLPDAFAEHAKELGRRYDSAERHRELADLQAIFAEEIGMVVQWATQVAAHMRVPLDMARPLSG